MPDICARRGAIKWALASRILPPRIIRSRLVRAGRCAGTPMVNFSPSASSSLLPAFVIRGTPVQPDNRVKGAKATNEGGPRRSVAPGSPAVARQAGLLYVSDVSAGVIRRRHGKSFRYFTPGGRPVNATEQRRISALAIPPAWTAVWICPGRSRAHPGHRTRCARPKTIPLPSGVAGDARPIEV